MLREGLLGTHATRVDASRPENNFPHDWDLKEDGGRQGPHGAPFVEIGGEPGDASGSNPKVAIAAMRENRKDKAGMLLGFGGYEFRMGFGIAQLQVPAKAGCGEEIYLAEPPPVSRLLRFLTGIPESAGC